MQKVFTTTNFKQTQKLGEILAKEIKKGAIICLVGELGSGKTTFTQGLLKGLKVKGPYTSPTFLVIKEYAFPQSSAFKNPKAELWGKKVYHIDTYRINIQDIIDLGWEEIISNKNNIVIIEWADRIKNIIPKNSLWINFKWLDENKRRIIFKNKI